MLIKTFKETVNELKNEEEVNPFKVFGIKITMMLIEAIGTGMASLISGLLSSGILNNKKWSQIETSGDYCVIFIFNDFILDK